IKDRPASLIAGNDLDMPESPARKADLLAAIEAGVIPQECLDRACARMLRLIAACEAGRTTEVPPVDPAAHHARARAMAAQSMVLVKNTGVLPLPASARRLLVVGRDAQTPVIQGSGCATTLPTQIDAPLEALRALLPATEILHCDTAEEAKALAAEADLILAFVSTEGAYDG
ncbi:glycosyl hydrolase, partial [Thioclava sp. BHET1]